MPNQVNVSLPGQRRSNAGYGEDTQKAGQPEPPSPARLPADGY
jgi:hypothetical protein